MSHDDREKKSFQSIFNEFSHDIKDQKNGHHYPGMNGESYDDEDYEEEDYSEEEDYLTDEMDHEILMHRDAHFGGDFTAMLDYYLEDKVGANPDLDIERIKYLAQVEEELGKDLAPLMLTGPEAERVAKARRAYQQLKALYEMGEENSRPQLIANLILSEEEEPEEEVEAIVALGSSVVPELIHILESDDSYDPLFPGYGYAPYLAVLCIERLQDPSAIIPLFEMLGRESVFGEEIVLDAFHAIGEPAKQFLLKQLQSRPLTEDNTRAGFGLAAFPQDEEVARVALNQLKDTEVWKNTILSAYLVCHCESLKEPLHREEFLALASQPDFPGELKAEIKRMAKEW